MLGLSRDPKNLQELFTLGIGPSKRDWLLERLEYIGVNTSNLPFRWHHVSLHDNGYAAYSDHFKGERFDEIKFHPTYEAKMWRWLRANYDLSYDDTMGFWIVGSEPQIDVIKPYFTNPE
jgi:hypothetical protein